MLAGVLIVIGAFWFMRSEDERDESTSSDFLESACTSVLVGKDASVDGSIMTMQACDRHIRDFTWHHALQKVKITENREGFVASTKMKNFHFKSFMI